MKPEVRLSSIVIAFAASLILAACGKDSVSAGSQIAARVNGKEIAAHRVDRLAGGIPGQPPGAATLAALDRLIDQELLAQQAEEIRLDRDPAVQLEIETAKHQILARTYVERNTRSRLPTPGEIDKYYHDHPALFEQRCLYRFKELIAAVDAGHRESFRRSLAGNSRLDDVAGWLQANGQTFHLTTTVKFAEQVPAALLPRIAAMNIGEIAIFEAPDSVSVLQLLQTQEVPLSQEEAKPLIENLLAEQKDQEFIQARTAQLRAQARIEYLGAFATPRGGTPPAAPVKQEQAAAAGMHVVKGQPGLS